MRTNKAPHLIESYATAMVVGLIGKVAASAALQHKLSKGELRELFVSDILKPFLPHQFGIGSGIVINQREDQSHHTDIVIFDRSVLPPFISQGHIGVYPAESVVATIEVKSRMDKEAITNTEASAKHLWARVYDPSADRYGFYKNIRPICALIGFYGRGAKELSSQNSGQEWLTANVKHLIAMCLPGKYSWLNLEGKGWSKSAKTDQFEETKRFIAIFLDNLRTQVAKREAHLSQFSHKDWVGLYIREHNVFE